jgi:hypothetical protein
MENKNRKFEDTLRLVSYCACYYYILPTGKETLN